MKNKKIPLILMIVFFIATLLIEVMRQILPRYTAKPPMTDGILTVIRSITFIIFAIALTAVIFPLLRNRFGKLKAVFFTVYSDCFIGFLIGALITGLAGSQNAASFGVTPLESIYYYFLGVFVMLISVSLTLVGMLTYAVTKGIIAFKEKKQQQKS